MKPISRKVPKNPILRREMIYQQRTSPPRLVRYEARIMVLLVEIMLVLMIVSVQNAISGYGAPYMLLLVLLALWLLHIIISIRLIISGVGIFSREFLNGTWESLILTGISKRKIFFGKWRAVVGRVWTWSITFVILWIALMVTFIFGDRYYSAFERHNILILSGLCPVAYITLVVMGFGNWLSGKWRSVLNKIKWIGLGIAILWILAILEPFVDKLFRTEDSFSVDISWRLFIICPLLFSTFAILEILTCTALGIAASTITRRGTTATILASAIRVIPSLLTGLVVTGSIFVPMAFGSNNMSFLGIMLGLADPGILIALANGTSSVEHAFVDGIIISFMFLVILLVVALIATTIGIRRTEIQSHL